MDNLVNVTNMVLDLFYADTKREKINLKVEYVDNIYERKLELAHNDIQRDIIEKTKNFSLGSMEQ